MSAEGAVLVGPVNKKSQLLGSKTTMMYPCNYTYMHTICCTHLGLIEIKMYICMSYQQKDFNLAYVVWQEVPSVHLLDL